MSYAKHCIIRSQGYIINKTLMLCDESQPRNTRQTYKPEMLSVLSAMKGDAKKGTYGTGTSCSVKEELSRAITFKLRPTE